VREHIQARVRFPGDLDNRMRTWPCAVIVIIVASLATRLPRMGQGLVDHDSWRQTDTATIARNFVEEPRILWPRIDWGAPGPGYVEAEFQLYPFAVSLIYRLTGEDPVYGRLLSLALTGVACLTFFAIARRFLEERTALAALSLFAMAPLVFRYSRAFMPEATALLFYLLALEQFLAFLDAQSWRPLLAAGVAMALAILVKPTTIHLGLVLLILAVSQMGKRAIVSRQLLVFGLLSLVPAALYYAHAARIHAVYGNTFGVLSGGDPKWGNPSYWFSWSFWEYLFVADSMWVAGPGAAILAVVGWWIDRRRSWRLLGASWAGTLLLYYLIVARYAGSARGLQYHLFAAPLVALMAGKGVEGVGRRLAAGRWAFLAVAAAAIALQVPLEVRLLGNRGGVLQREAGLAVARLSAPSDLLLVLSSDEASDRGVPNNHQEPNVFFFARRRGRVLANDRQTATAFDRELATGLSWFVNFPVLNKDADSSFLPEVRRRTQLAATGPGFEVRRVLVVRRDPGNE
jgi:4-amino-4-deoxy-L-arabinose transferase-like glycosyltransferase